MKKIKIAINGFGRIGRNLLRILCERNEIDVVAINDLGDSNTMAHLFKYDSIHRKFKGEVISTANALHINGHQINFYSQPNPIELPWNKLDIDIVIECTGRFVNKEACSSHLIAGAKKVILSSPSIDNSIKMIVVGVNDQLLSNNDSIISNASCTTNCAAPMIKILNEQWNINNILISTVHSFTNDQHLHDFPHTDLRRARAATQSIIPTSTGAIRALETIFPDLREKMGGYGIRVPVANGSLTDLTCTLSKTPTISEINKVFKNASNTYMKGVIEFAEEPLVSVDIIGNTSSCIFDPSFTFATGNMVKIIGWYDNETGYSNRLVDLLLRIGKIKSRI